MTSCSDEKGPMMELRIPGHDGVGRTKVGWQWTGVCRDEAGTHSGKRPRSGTSLRQGFGISASPLHCKYRAGHSYADTQTGWIQLLEGGQLGHLMPGHPKEAFAEADVPSGC